MNTIPMSDIRDAAAAAGSKWFSRGAMRFFGTRLPRTGLRDAAGKVWFITSDSTCNTQRRYSLRVFFPETGEVATVGSFRAHATSRDAQRARDVAMAVPALSVRTFDSVRS